MKSLMLGCALLFVSTAVAQNTEKWGFAYKAIGGYVWAHKGEVDNLKAHIYGGSLEFRYRTANNKQWHRIYNRPAWGVKLYYAYLGKPNILGSVIGILPYAELPVIKKQKWEINFRAASGMGYITQPFNVTENTPNRTIGSHLNGNMSLHGVLNIFLSEKTELNLIGGVTHFSNGNFKMPNLGVNLPDIGIGLSHYLGKREIETPQPDNFDTSKHEVTLALISGRKNTDHIFSYFVFPVSLQTKYLHRMSLRSKLGGGLDITYDEGNFYVDNRTGTAGKGAINQAMELGLKIAHELKVNRVSFVSDIGFYLYNKNYVKGPIYQRLGFRYEASPTLSAYCTLKAHFARADYFEWGIGYTIRKN